MKKRKTIQERKVRKFHLRNGSLTTREFPDFNKRAEKAKKKREERKLRAIERYELRQQDKKNTQPKPFGAGYRGKNYRPPKEGEEVGEVLDPDREADYGPKPSRSPSKTFSHSKDVMPMDELRKLTYADLETSEGGYYLYKGRLFHRIVYFSHFPEDARCISTNQIHHINGNKLDNRISNLILVSKQLHDKIHKTWNMNNLPTRRMIHRLAKGKLYDPQYCVKDSSGVIKP